jgi:tRNA threonylcarbamoyladenosine biosynthesis protein TsaB
MNENSRKQPLIVTVETSGRKGSVALAEGENLLEQCDFSAPMRHSAELLAAIEGLLSRFDKSPSQIGQVHISIGPGSFTGLRIAVTFAKTLHMANNCQIVAVDTLDVIASNVTDASQYKRIGTILDAKRGQFFTATYELKKTAEGNVQYEKTLVDCLMTAAEFIEKCVDTEQPIWLLGEGLVYYQDKFKAEGVEFLDEQYWWPKASKVHTLGWAKALKGEFENPLQLQPFYLRQPQLGISRMHSNYGQSNQQQTEKD